jgi:hypothetical protein
MKTYGIQLYIYQLLSKWKGVSVNGLAVHLRHHRKQQSTTLNCYPQGSRRRGCLRCTCSRTVEEETFNMGQHDQEWNGWQGIAGTLLKATKFLSLYFVFSVRLVRMIINSNCRYRTSKKLQLSKPCKRGFMSMLIMSLKLPQNSCFNSDLINLQDEIIWKCRHAKCSGQCVI